MLCPVHAQSVAWTSPAGARANSRISAAWSEALGLTVQTKTVQEVAEFLQVSPATVYQLCATRKLAHLRVGAGRGTIRVRQEDLDAFVESCKIIGPKPIAQAGLKH